MEFEYDPEAPYWRANADPQALYTGYGREGQEATDLLDGLGLADPESPPGQVAVMDGRFLPLLTNSKTHQWTFTPGAGTERAIVLPVHQDGQIVDLLALSADDVVVWGCVTGIGTRAGDVPNGQPIRVYEAPWRWLLFGCDGVVILDQEAFAALSAAPAIFAESLDHADDLTERAFVLPAMWSSQKSKAAQDIAIQNAEFEARDRIHIDEERYDVDREILQRSVVQTVCQLSARGVLN